jgi:1-acyl-sn-glycerol-3-phosphate acyltransferase
MTQFDPSIAPPQPGGRTKVARQHTAFKLAQGFCRIVTTCMFDLKVWGVEHVPRTGGVLIVSNHQSVLDPTLLGVRLPRALSYMAKSELFEVNAFFTWMIRALGAFPVRQTGSAAGAVKESIERLREGRGLVIYPEGSRTPDGNLLPIERGVALVIRRAKVPVVPAVIDGSFGAWPIGQSAPRPFPIRMMYGPAMDLAELKPEEIIAQIGTTLGEMFKTLRERRRMEEEGMLGSLSPAIQREGFR